MAKTGRRGLCRLGEALRHSWRGLQSCWQREAAFRQELLACLILVPAALWYGEDGTEKALLIAACLLVLLTEVLNSAIETVVDRIGEERHDLSGLAKDLGSAAVLLSMLVFLSIWGLVLLF